MGGLIFMTKKKREILAELAVILIDEYKNYFNPIDPEEKPDSYKLTLLFKLMNNKDKQEALEYLLKKEEGLL